MIKCSRKAPPIGRGTTVSEHLRSIWNDIIYPYVSVALDPCTVWCGVPRVALVRIYVNQFHQTLAPYRPTCRAAWIKVQNDVGHSLAMPSLTRKEVRLEVTSYFASKPIYRETALRSYHFTHEILNSARMQLWIWRAIKNIVQEMTAVTWSILGHGFTKMISVRLSISRESRRRDSVVWSRHAFHTSKATSTHILNKPSWRLLSFFRQWISR